MDARMKVLTAFGLIGNMVLIILVASQLIGVREEVRDLSRVLATKQDVAALRPIRIAEALETRCTTCHSERRFTGAHGGERDLVALIRRMQAQPGAEIPPGDVGRIHASLTLLQCTRCHGEEMLQRLTLQSREGRAAIVREMQKKPGSGISPDQVAEILRSYEMLLGF